MGRGARHGLLEMKGSGQILFDEWAERQLPEMKGREGKRNIKGG